MQENEIKKERTKPRRVLANIHKEVLDPFMYICKGVANMNQFVELCKVFRIYESKNTNNSNTDEIKKVINRLIKGKVLVEHKHYSKKILVASDCLCEIYKVSSITISSSVVFDKSCLLLGYILQSDFFEMKSYDNRYNNVNVFLKHINASTTLAERAKAQSNMSRYLKFPVSQSNSFLHRNIFIVAQKGFVEYKKQQEIFEKYKEMQLESDDKKISQEESSILKREANVFAAKNGIETNHGMVKLKDERELRMILIDAHHNFTKARMKKLMKYLSGVFTKGYNYKVTLTVVTHDSFLVGHKIVHNQIIIDVFHVESEYRKGGHAAIKSLIESEGVYQIMGDIKDKDIMIEDDMEN